MLLNVHLMYKSLKKRQTSGIQASSESSVYSLLY